MNLSSAAILLLCNPHSRRGDQAARTVRAVFEEHGREVIEAQPEGREDMARLIERHRERVGTVAIAGGDGTLNAAAEALARTGLTLGIIPGGTANDLARTLGLPLTPAAAARVIVSGRARRVDLGCVNGHAFFNAAHVGLGVEVAKRLNGQAKGRWGALAYAKGLWQALRASQPFTVELRYQGRRQRRRAIEVGVGNGCFYGGGVRIAADAAIDDGGLDVYSLGPRGFWRLLALVPVLHQGEQRRAGIWALRTPALELRTRRPRPVVADGEFLTRTPAHFTVRPGAVSIWVPDDGAGPRP
ncbi:lipid kinase [Alkalilimnicola sp. S0819]|uniref:lipid kinase n=1 Tax=Alkalilimnicola sp. S0819 TaxID=2613922 RepID=UPI00186A3CD7|nr:lipid kinase [Alkalilimnicola sp. S0819]